MSVRWGIPYFGGNEDLYHGYMKGKMSNTQLFAMMVNSSRTTFIWGRWKWLIEIFRRTKRYFRHVETALLKLKKLPLFNLLHLRCFSFWLLCLQSTGTLYRPFMLCYVTVFLAFGPFFCVEDHSCCFFFLIVSLLNYKLQNKKYFFPLKKKGGNAGVLNS